MVVEDAEGALDLYSKGATPTQACTEYELCTEEVVRLAQQQLAR